MTLKQHLKSSRISIASLSKTTGIAYSTLNGIINHKVDIDRVQVGIAVAIAKACNMSFDTFYHLCKNIELPVFENAEVIIRNKEYMLRYHTPKGHFDTFICKVNPINTSFLTDLSKWAYEDVLEAQELKAMEEEGWAVRYST